MVTTIDLSKLRNSEFQQFGALLAGLVPANDPVVLNIATQHSAFKVKLDETAGLFQLERASQTTQEYGAANPDTLKSKRKETMVAFYELRKFVDANSVLHPSETTEKLIRELNAQIDQYNWLIKLRPADAGPQPAAVNN